MPETTLSCPRCEAALPSASASCDRCGYAADVARPALVESLPGLRATNLVLVAVLSSLSLGLYSPVWFWRRREALNRLRSSTKLDRRVLVLTFVLLALSVLLFDRHPHARTRYRGHSRPDGGQERGDGLPAPVPARADHAMGAMLSGAADPARPSQSPSRAGRVGLVALHARVPGSLSPGSDQHDPESRPGPRRSMTSTLARLRPGLRAPSQPRRGLRRRARPPALPRRVAPRDR